MERDELRAAQAPLKERYRANPAAAMLTLRAESGVGEGVSCSIRTAKALVEAGLHPMTGGDGSLACSGDMLLEALVACAGVTLASVATARGVAMRDARVFAEGDLDFRGTLGVASDAPVGFKAIRLRFQIDSDAPEADIEDLVRVTQRYCVVLQTLTSPPPVTVSLS